MTQQDIDEIRVHVRQAKDPKAQVLIEADLNCCEPEDIMHLLSAGEMDRDIPAKPPRFSAEDKAAAVELVKQGTTKQKVAEMYGVSWTAVNYWCKKSEETEGEKPMKKAEEKQAVPEQKDNLQAFQSKLDEKKREIEDARNAIGAVAKWLYKVEDCLDEDHVKALVDISDRLNGVLIGICAAQEALAESTPK